MNEKTPQIRLILVIAIIAAVAFSLYMDIRLKNATKRYDAIIAEKDKDFTRVEVENAKRSDELAKQASLLKEVKESNDELTGRLDLLTRDLQKISQAPLKKAGPVISFEKTDVKPAKKARETEKERADRLKTELEAAFNPGDNTGS